MTSDNISDTLPSRSKKKMSNAVGDDPVGYLPDIPSVKQYSLPADANPNASAKSPSGVMERKDGSLRGNDRENFVDSRNPSEERAGSAA